MNQWYSLKLRRHFSLRKNQLGVGTTETTTTTKAAANENDTKNQINIACRQLELVLEFSTVDFYRRRVKSKCFTKVKFPNSCNFENSIDENVRIV